MRLSDEQIAIIKSTVPILEQYGATITQSFYDNVLEENPTLCNIFSRSHQSTGHQAAALAGSLHAYASNIDNLGALGSALELICNKHTSLYIQPEHYPVVGTYLLAAMKRILGDALTPEIHDAWKDAYFQLADIMIAKEAEIYARSNGWTDWKKLKVQRKQRETEDITSFYLVPTDGTSLPSYKPGQYISVRIHVDALGYAQPRQYSLSDAPGKDYFRISVKREQGISVAHPAYVSNLLHDTLNEGDLIDVSHPMGDFFLEPPSKPTTPTEIKMTCPFHKASTSATQDDTSPLVLISAGVGITPMMSILNTQLSTPEIEKRPITLLHGACTDALRPFASDVAAMQEKPNADLQTAYFNSRSSDTTEDKARSDSPIDNTSTSNKSFEGRMDLETVKGLLEERGLKDEKTLYFVCGPTSFMTDVRRKLVEEWNVEAQRVRLELFGTGGLTA